MLPLRKLQSLTLTVACGAPVSLLIACADKGHSSDEPAAAVEEQANAPSESTSSILVTLVHTSGEHQAQVPLTGAPNQDELHVKASCTTSTGAWTSVGVVLAQDPSKELTSNPFSLRSLPESPTTCTIGVYSGGMTTALKPLGESCWADEKVVPGPCAAGGDIPASPLELTDVALSQNEGLTTAGWFVEAAYTYTFGPDAPDTLSIRATCEIAGDTVERSSNGLDFTANAPFSKPGDRFRTGVSTSIGPFTATPEACTVRFESSGGDVFGAFCLRDASTTPGPC